jgi:hypothetical protein
MRVNEEENYRRNQNMEPEGSLPHSQEPATCPYQNTE